jgi:hypothetical protein
MSANGATSPEMLTYRSAGADRNGGGGGYRPLRPMKTTMSPPPIAKRIAIQLAGANSDIGGSSVGADSVRVPISLCNRPPASGLSERPGRVSAGLHDLVAERQDPGAVLRPAVGAFRLRSCHWSGPEPEQGPGAESSDGACPAPSIWAKDERSPRLLGRACQPVPPFRFGIRMAVKAGRRREFLIARTSDDLGQDHCPGRRFLTHVWAALVCGASRAGATASFRGGAPPRRGCPSQVAYRLSPYARDLVWPS